MLAGWCVQRRTQGVVFRRSPVLMALWPLTVGTGSYYLRNSAKEDFLRGPFSQTWMSRMVSAPWCLRKLSQEPVLLGLLHW
jgi:hypothetical protein